MRPSGRSGTGSLGRQLRPARRAPAPGPAAGGTMSQQITISRVFDAPPELVYRAFTDPDQLARWFGPVGCSVPRDSISVDARPGGHLRFVMTAPDRRNPWVLTFTEVGPDQPTAGGLDDGRAPRRHST